MYHRLEGAPDDDPELAPVAVKIISDTDVPWGIGVFHADPVPQPIKAIVAPGSGRVMPDLILSDPPLFSSPLIAALKEGGVDNLQLFDAEIADLRHGRVHNQYKAANIVGAVGCADLDASVFDEASEPPYMAFAKLVVDEKKARGLPLFRLAEATDVILVSERVKRALEAARLVGVRASPLVEPEESPGADSDDDDGGAPP